MARALLLLRDGSNPASCAKEVIITSGIYIWSRLEKTGALEHSSLPTLCVLRATALRPKPC